MAVLSLTSSLRADTPFLEARFNEASALTVENGATIGAKDAGVSGKPGDLAYSAKLSGWLDTTPGPFASLEQAAPEQNLENLTISGWYKANSELSGAATLIDTGLGSMLWDDKGRQWVLRLAGRVPSNDKPLSYWFYSGKNPPLGSWEPTGDWVFFAAVWDRAEKKVVFYQGSKSAPVAKAAEPTRNEDVDPLEEIARVPRLIGNCSRKEKDRPFDGSIDDVRLFRSALTLEDLEKIRKADLGNEAVR